MRGRELKFNQMGLRTDMGNVRPHARAGVEMLPIISGERYLRFALMRGRELK